MVRHILLSTTFVLATILPALSSKVDTLIIQSTFMSKEIKNVVVTPDNYNANSEPYAVLYLLHGAGGSYASWVRGMPDVKDFSDQYNIILVFPDGGKTSWYLDSPIDKEMQYESYVTVELVSSVDKNYNTIIDKSARAITGLSMGGHGAFYLAFRHPDIWGAAGSMSGGLDIRPFPNNWDIAERLGPYQENKEYWENNTVINLVYLLNGKNLKLIFDCGVDDFFYKVNLNMHEKLLTRKIPHEYIERPGGHTRDYWNNSIKYQVLFFATYFEAKTTN